MINIREEICKEMLKSISFICSKYDLDFEKTLVEFAQAVICSRIEFIFNEEDLEKGIDKHFKEIN